MAKPVWSTVTTKPLTGILDNRSLPADMPPGSFRTRLNWKLSGGTKLARRGGHERLFAGLTYDLTHAVSDPLYAPRYTNWDLHDQGGTRQALTMLFDAQLNTGQHYLYAGTQGKVWFLNETTGIWTPVVSAVALGGAAGVGVSQTRWRVAELQERLILVNGVDRVQTTVVGTTGLVPMPELNQQGALNLNVTAAKVVASFNGFALVMNLVEDGVRQSSRIRWSDYNRPTVWVSDGGTPPLDTNLPGPASNQATLSGFQDLDYGADILAAVEMAGALYILTTKAIWRATIGSTKAFDFVKVYSEPKTGARCIFFPNTAVSIGSDIFYAGINGIYRWNPYIPEPERLEWLYRGTAEMFDDDTFAGDVTACQSVIMEAVPGADKIATEIFVSWPEASGGVYGENTKTLAFNYEAKSVSTIDHGYTAFVNYSPNPPAGDLCKSKPIFIGASAEDWCLKQIGTAFSRERCTNAATGTGTAPFVGTYVYDGYYSILRGMLPLANYDAQKEINNFLIEAHAAVQAVPCVVRLRLGDCYSEADPALPDGQCSVIWHRLADLPLRCLDTRTGTQSDTQNRYRDFGMEWSTLRGGRFLFFEIVIANTDGSPAIGGDCTFERFEMSVRLLPKA